MQVKNLADILSVVKILDTYGGILIRITGVVFDSRKVVPGCVFVAVKGTRVDGHKFIPQAIESGAKAIVMEEVPFVVNPDVTYIRTDNSARALGRIASAFYDTPSARLKLIGVTGTNGKTTVATLLYKMFKHLGYKSGLLSTVANYIDEEHVAATHTTPDPVQLNALLDKMVDQGVEYCFMEVSSHAVHQERIAGLEFKGGIFTNITHDHLDYHTTFDNYLAAKRKFFDALKPEAFALTNTDDRNGRIMVQNTKASVHTYSIKSLADYKAHILESHFHGMLLTIDNHEIWVQLIGEFNAYNLLAVYGATRLLGIQETDALRVLSVLTTVDGRFQPILSPEGKTAIVDYAHTPDALMNVLSTIKKIKKPVQEVITIVGAGGDRDKKKRPLMASVASELSSKVILTSDNPRNEDPEAILKDMKEGVKERKNVLVITDRKEAIKAACMMAGHKDIILIAGKGHETYQEIKGVKYPFDDREIVRQNFELKA